MTAQVFNGERALGVHVPLLQLLDLWKEHGGHDVLVAPEGGYRFGFVDEAKQENLFRAKLSKARTLRETPHGRRCAVDVWPVGFNPHRGFGDPSNAGMLERFNAWGAFVDQHGPALGIRWGGHFPGFGPFGDMPHAEIATWATAFRFPGGEPVVHAVPTSEQKP